MAKALTTATMTTVTSVPVSEIIEATGTNPETVKGTTKTVPVAVPATVSPDLAKLRQKLGTICKICKFRVCGVNHEKGAHHKGQCKHRVRK